MAKKVAADEFVSPANLWGKPLPRTPNKPTTTKETSARMLPDEEIDSAVVDAELEENDIEEPSEAELLADEAAEEEEPADNADDDSEDTENDDDDEDFEAEAGDDDGVSDVADVAEEVPAAVSKTAATQKVRTKMADKKSISDHVRDEITARKAAGESLRGVDIVNALAKRRITVSPAQVSQLLKKAGVSQKARGGRKAGAVAVTEERSRSALKAKKVEPRREAPKVRATTGTTTELPWKQLNAAKAFIAACNGSFDEASDALAMFHKIENVLHN